MQEQRISTLSQQYEMDMAKKTKEYEHLQKKYKSKKEKFG